MITIEKLDFKLLIDIHVYIISVCAKIKVKENST